MKDVNENDVILTHGMTRGARNAFIFIGVVFLIVTIALTWGEARFQTTSDDFTQLKGGLCKLLNDSNKSQVANHTLLLNQAHRAELRAKVDEADGNMTAVQSDQDAAKLYRKIASQSHQIDVTDFGCKPNPKLPPPPPTT